MGSVWLLSMMSLAARN